MLIRKWGAFVQSDAGGFSDHIGMAIRAAIFRNIAVAIITSCVVIASAQDPQDSSPAQILYQAIKAQEANFPVPTPTGTVTVGTITVGGGVRYETNYEDGSGYQIGFPHQPDGEDRSTISYIRYDNVGGRVTAVNIHDLSLRFAITGWRAGQTTPLTIQIGDQTVSVAPGQSEVVVPIGASNSYTLSISDPYLKLRAVRANAGERRTLPILIERHIVAAGAMTIPVLPVTVIYVPPVDFSARNGASTSTAYTFGTTASASFVTSTSNTTPIPSSFQETADIADGMGTLGSNLQKIPNPYTVAIGKALSTISSGLGTSTAQETNATTKTVQNSLQIGGTEQITIVAIDSQGGPGVGDVIAYLRNVRICWYSDNGNMQLALIDHGGLVLMTAGKLKSIASSLRARPAGTLDPTFGLSLDDSNALIGIDPFAAIGPTTVLDPRRFVPADIDDITTAAAVTTYSAEHTITSTDTSTSQTTKARSETDKPGFLAALGIGVTNEGTFQTQFSLSNSVQTLVGTKVSRQYTLYGDPEHPYRCKVYYDRVFGTFAFRQIPVNGP